MGRERGRTTVLSTAKIALGRRVRSNRMRGVGRNILMSLLFMRDRVFLDEVDNIGRTKYESEGVV